MQQSIMYIDENGKQQFVEAISIFSINSITGKPEVLESTNGSINTNPKPGPQAQPRNRYFQLASNGAARTIDFDNGSNITELNFRPLLAIGETESVGTDCLVCLDPPNNNLRDNYLTQADSLVNDIQWYPLEFKIVTRLPLTHPLVQGINSGGALGFKGVGGKVINVWMGAS